MRNARHRTLLASLFLALVVLISFSLHVDDLLQGTLFESAIVSSGTRPLLTSVGHEINIHLNVLVGTTHEAVIYNLLANVVILRVAPNLDL